MDWMGSMTIKDFLGLACVAVFLVTFYFLALLGVDFMIAFISGWEGSSLYWVIASAGVLSTLHILVVEA